MGAALAYPGRQVVAMCGDGGFAMLLSELLTLRQLKVPVKVIVFNNNSYGFVELEMKAAGTLEYGSSIVRLSPPFTATVRSSIVVRGRPSCEKLKSESRRAAIIGSTLGDCGRPAKGLVEVAT